MAEALLRLAAETVAAAARGAARPPLPVLPADVASCGVFVSLYREGALRGCIGHLEGDRPLAGLVQEMAVAASREDPRFPPVAAEELEGLEVELSLLTALAPARPHAVVAGRDGVVIRRGRRQGALLPQVARFYGWDAETVLAMACRKAGLAPGAWKEPDVTLLTFAAHIVGPQRL